MAAALEVEAAEAAPIPARFTDGAGEGTVNRHLGHVLSLAGGCMASETHLNQLFALI